MTGPAPEPLRIALVHHCFGSGESPDGERVVGDVADALRAGGHHAEILSVQAVGSLGLVESVLRIRGFAAPLSHVPFCIAALRNGGFDAAHAFTPQDALAALLWRRLSSRPVVFSPAEPVRRETMADRRLSLQLLERAIKDCDAVRAPTEECRDAMRRWLALDVPLLAPRDPVGYERLYRELLRDRGPRRRAAVSSR